MLGYFTSLLATNKQRTSLYITGVIFIIANIFLIIGLYLAKINFPYSTESIYITFIPTLSFLNFVIFWFLFYKNMHSNTAGSNIEILSFTSGLSRKKIFLSKFLNHVTLVSIHSLLTAILFLITTIIVYGNLQNKLLQAFFGTLLIGFFGGILFYFLMFFIDTLSRRAKRKRSLAFIPFLVTTLLFVILPSVELISKIAISQQVSGKGINDFNDIKILKKDGSKIPISLSQKLTYTAYSQGESKEYPRDINLYNSNTNSHKYLAILTKYLNFSHVLSQAQGIEKESQQFFDNLYTYYNNFNSVILDNALEIKVASGNNSPKTLYFLDNKIDDEISTTPNESWKILLNEKINKIVNNLQANPEFQKASPEWKVLKKFLNKEIENSFPLKEPITSETIVRNKELEKEQIFLSDFGRLIGLDLYIYLKSNYGNKVLKIPANIIEKTTRPISEDGSFKIEYFDENGVNISVPEDPQEFSQFQKEVSESQQINRTFERSFLDISKPIFAIRQKTNDYEYPWISYLIIAILIIGFGYWSLDRYLKKDVA